LSNKETIRLYFAHAMPLILLVGPIFIKIALKVTAIVFQVFIIIFHLLSLSNFHYFSLIHRYTKNDWNKHKNKGERKRVKMW